MDSDDQPTCGKGVAASADLPARLAALMATRGEVLERHSRALDLTDPNSRQEFEAYTDLVRRHRDVAAALDSLAQQMRGCRDLPMGRHDFAAMAAPDGQMEAFRRFVGLERELVAFLEAKLVDEEKMLA
jgi:hypothetical protein